MRHFNKLKLATLFCFIGTLGFFYLNQSILCFDQKTYQIFPVDQYILAKSSYTERLIPIPYPLLIPNREGHFTSPGALRTEFNFDLPLPFVARVAVIDVDDCLDEVMINQSVLKFREIPYCNYNRPLELQLPSTLVASTLFPLQERWSVSLRFTNRGGPGKIYFRLKPAAKVELFLRVFQLIFATTFFFLLAWQFRKNKLSILELYNSHVEWFEKKRNPNLMEKKYLDALIVQMPAKGKILDLGCGIGTPIARYFSQNNFQVTGVDGAEKMIHKARQLAPDGRWIVADMRSLSLGEAFDAIVAWDSFFHLTHEEQRQMFAIFKNHLNPGGILLFTSGPAEGVAIGEMNGHELFHSSLSSEEYKKLLIQNGLEVIDHQIEDPECGYHTVWLARILTHKS